MSEWPLKKLGELIEIKYGKDHKNLGIGNIPVYGTGGIMRFADKFLYDDESILIPRKGSLNNIYYINYPFWTVDTLFWSKKKSENIDMKFLFYYLSVINFSNMNVGTAIPSLTTQLLNDILINIPSLPEQQKIALILSSLDDKIELNNQMNETLEEMAQTLFKRWFVDFEFPNEEGLPYKSSGGDMVPSELGEIPKGWEVLPLENVVENIVDNRGKTPQFSNFGNKVIETYQISIDKSFPTFNEKQKYVAEDTYNNWFRSGHPKYLDILCGLVGNGITKWCFTPKGSNYCIAQNVIALRADCNKISPYFLKSHMNTYSFLSEVKGRILTTAQPSIKVGHLISIPVILPTRSVIQSFDNIVKPFYDSIGNNAEEIYSLTKTRDLLLPKLMSGEIRV